MQVWIDEVTDEVGPVGGGGLTQRKYLVEVTFDVSYPLFLELFYFRLYHHLTIGVRTIQIEIILVIIFGFVENT